MCSFCRQSAANKLLMLTLCCAKIGKMKINTFSSFVNLCQILLICVIENGAGMIFFSYDTKVVDYYWELSLVEILSIFSLQ